MKHSILKRKFHRIRKVSKRKLPIAKMDRAYQDFFRSLCAEFGIPSEVSGEPMEVCHHYIEKSKSAALQFDPINFVPLTHREHSQHHLAGDPTIIATVALKRGEEWLKEINERRKNTETRDKEWLFKAQLSLEGLDTPKGRKALAQHYKKYGWF